MEPGTFTYASKDYQFLQSLFEYTNDIISYATPDGVCQYVSPAVVTLLGYEQLEMLGKQVTDFYHPDEMEHINSIAEKLFSGTEHDRFTCRVRHKLGHYLWFETTLKAVHNELGDLALIVGIGRDITERIVTEEALRRSEANLALAQRIAHLGSWEWDTLRDKVCWSEETHRIHGCPTSSEEMTRQRVMEFVHPDDQKKFEQAVETTLQHGRVEFEYRVLRPDGSTRVLHAQCNAVYDSAGNPVRLVGTVLDITERKQAEQLLLEAEKLSAVGQLAAGVAHEIRNPLTSLKGFVQLLAPSFGQNDRQKRYLEVMRSELNRIENILSELLLLAKSQPVQFRPVDVILLLDDVMTLLETQASLKGIVLSLNYDRTPRIVLCESNQLKQVFVNVIKNAIEAMPHGGTIDIKLDVNEHGLYISIHDQGDGILPEHLDKIGVPFFSTKETGTGLGMMISFRIIQIHRGSLDISSQVGEGTTVTIRLPLRRGHDV